MKNTLIICIGNEIRSDDAVAIHLKKELEKLVLPFVEIISVHQLTPELAEIISKFDKVIFADASLETLNEPVLKKIEVDENFVFHSSLNHTFSPESLIYLTRKLYNNSPEAYLLSIPVVNLDFGTELHPNTKQNLFKALETLKNFLT